MDTETDVAIIGAGTAGIGAYLAARRHTDQIRLIEAGPGGTTCARVGCMPSKLLIAAAEAAHAVNDAARFGIDVPAARIDGAAVMRRVREERDRFVRLVLEDVASYPAEHRIHGRARFIDDHRLEIDDGSRIRAKRIVIATGSRTHVPPEWPDLGDRLVTSDELFSWQSLPESIAVVGGGAIGIELGQALHRLGVRVRLLDLGKSLKPLSDPEVIAAARRILGAELPWSSGIELQSLRREADGVRIDWLQDGKAHAERFDFLLAATGRRPDLQSLQLENTGLRLDARGIPVFDPATAQCSLDHIFIAGDVDGQLPLLHEAADDARVAGSNAGRHPDSRPQQRRAGLQILFSDPQIAVAGLGLDALKQTGIAYCEAAQSFDNQGRSRVLGRNAGLLKLYADAQSGEFLGAEMIAPQAEHLAHLLAWCRQMRLDVEQMLGLPFYHPTIEEGLRSGLRELRRALGRRNTPPAGCLDCGPGS